MSINIDRPNVIDVHIDKDGKPVVSISGVIISCIVSVDISTGEEQFNQATIRCLVNLRPDDSHIMK